ncbi:MULTISPECIES: UDP-N-acetylmuramate--L-alanine ligase [Muribaculum]|jgi:UDP-N-acetylmuramate--L-alanine ligase|uniref:UDP-N-acetylmuramate--L-alanine ligase n=22 Tax=Muribaculum TaxID=1918540 RepID=A0A4P7VR62_9BACT|nr:MULTISPECIES: UDP-N-acetylmuramate--L-alanine ligase [Muribaculum]MCX4277634.1 UDP-N-acetylmuramate--L-alanine ligase [Muribaculum sp.]QCD36826.1 UDP-N-acetylmuramate--L-alanine ligase [Muribaculum gordoncarteri]ROT15762.1 UDP-N-acetylmuramate--L-alanine ligase [Muribaculaceae bacterium Isolate-102 (HZI)]
MSHKKIYFAGAGGIGMAALERYFLAKGCRVAGYDRTPTDLTRALQDEGVEITFDESVEAIPADFKGCPEEVLVVYTPALPDMHPGLSYFRENGYEVVKRAAVLGNITRDTKGLCFAGTHGKTTTSSMAAHILNTCKVGCNAFLGGILRNYNSNLLLSATSPYSVIEADEYDRSFHHLRPYIAVITATDPDHLDIYGTEEAYLESFAHFTELIKPGGMLVVHEDLKLKPRVPEGVKIYTYSRDKGDFHAENIRRGNGEITFDIVTPSETVRDITLGVPVEINIENAIAAFAACYLTGDIEIDAARDAIASFMGPKRRFEFWLKEPGAEGRAIIDDYAHHPDELRASIMSVKSLYPGRRLTVAFQPHLYSRTRDFAPEFAASLSLADEVILLDIYPAREEPIPGVTSEIIFNDIKCKDKVMIDKQHLTETIKNRNFEILLTVGAGDICNYLPEIVKNVNLR